MGRALRLTVIAEGVEEPFQLERLRKLRCGRAQGYYLARPLPAEELERLFTQPEASWIRGRGSRPGAAGDLLQGRHARRLRSSGDPIGAERVSARTHRTVLSAYWGPAPLVPQSWVWAARWAVTRSGLKQGKPAERRGRKARDLPEPIRQDRPVTRSRITKPPEGGLRWCSPSEQPRTMRRHATWETPAASAPSRARSDDPHQRLEPRLHRWRAG